MHCMGFFLIFIIKHGKYVRLTFYCYVNQCLSSYSKYIFDRKYVRLNFQFGDDV